MCVTFTTSSQQACSGRPSAPTFPTRMELGASPEQPIKQGAVRTMAGEGQGVPKQTGHSTQLPKANQTQTLRLDVLGESS